MERLHSHDHGGFVASAAAWFTGFLEKESIVDNVPFVEARRAEKHQREVQKALRRLSRGPRASPLLEPTASITFPPDESKYTILDFLNHTGGTPSASKEAFARFCGKITLESFRSSSAEPESSKCRLDDRSDIQTPRTKRKTDLSAYALYDLIKHPRFRQSNLPDVPRRIITILDPTPYHFFALAETASIHQREQLIEDVFNFLMKKSQIKIDKSLRGIKTLRITFSIPLFVIRCLKNRPSEGWDDLSGLDGDNDDGKHMLYKSRSVFSLCADNDKTWTAIVFREIMPDGFDYCDQSTELDGEDDEEEEEEDDVPEPDLDAEDKFMDEDPNLFDVQHIDHDITSSREYALSVLARMVSDFLKETNFLAYKLGPLIDELVAHHKAENPIVMKTLRSSERNAAELDLQVKRTNARRMVSILDTIHAQLRTSMEDFEHFLKIGGGVELFEFDHNHVLIDLLARIKQDVQQAGNLTKAVSRLHQTCDVRARQMDSHVAEQHLEMTKQSAEAAKESAEIAKQSADIARQTYEHTTDMVKMGKRQEDNVSWHSKLASITFRIVVPMALASAFLAMPETAVPFKATFLAFALLSICLSAMMAICAELFSWYETWKASPRGPNWIMTTLSIAAPAMPLPQFATPSLPWLNFVVMLFYRIRRQPVAAGNPATIPV